MEKGRNIVRRLMEEADLAAEALPGHPIVELAGDRRVLVENHQGVMEYSRCRITVKVAYGQVAVVGECLKILRMTRQQLVIRGNIGGISLCRRERP